LKEQETSEDMINILKVNEMADGIKEYEQKLVNHVRRLPGYRLSNIKHKVRKEEQLWRSTVCVTITVL
jgi:hypothetical protein